MDRLAHITAFVRVAESGGFTAAARRLNMSTTSVSEHVQALEEALGVRLLNRTTRRVSLTEVGRDYFERCSQILHELEEADQAASALQLTPRGQLRVFCHQGMGRLIAPVLTRFLASYPEVSVELRTGDVIVDLVQEGFDLAIMHTAPPDSSLVRRRLAVWHYLLCCSSSYLDTHPAPQNPTEIAGHNCLLYTYSVFGHDWPFVGPDGNRVLARVSGSLITTSIEAMRAAAVAGLGLWLAPPAVMADLIASGALVRLLPDYRTPEMEIVALYPHRRYVSAKVRIFIDRLVADFAENQGWLGGIPAQPKDLEAKHPANRPDVSASG